MMRLFNRFVPVLKAKTPAPKELAFITYRDTREWIDKNKQLVTSYQLSDCYKMLLLCEVFAS